MVGCDDSVAPKSRARKAGPQVNDRFGAIHATRLRHGQHLSRFNGQTNGPQSVTTADLENKGGDSGMQMKVFVCVDMVERKAGGAKGCKLGADLRLELPARVGPSKHGQSRPDHIVSKVACIVDERRRPSGRQNRFAVDQH